MNFKSVDQVAIAVRDLGSVQKTLQETWGFKVSENEVIEEQGVKLCFVSVGETRLEFMEPTGPQTPVGRFLEKRGSGIQHIAFSVDNLEATLKSLKEKGVELINEKPKFGAGGAKIAFVHPKSFFGILLELIENPD